MNSRRNGPGTWITPSVMGESICLEGASHLMGIHSPRLEDTSNPRREA